MIAAHLRFAMYAPYFLQNHSTQMSRLHSSPWCVLMFVSTEVTRIIVSTSVEFRAVAMNPVC